MLLHTPDDRVIHGSRTYGFRSRRSPDGYTLPKPVSIINSVDDRCVVDAERVNNTNGGQTIYGNTRLSIDMKNFFLAVDPVGSITGRTVVIGEKAVQARSKNEDVARLCNSQAPRSFLSSTERWILPLGERSVEGTGRWRAGLEIRRLGLWKAKVMIRSTGEVVVNEDVVL